MNHGPAYYIRAAKMKLSRQHFSLVLLFLTSFAMMGFSSTRKSSDESAPPPRILRVPDWNDQQAAEWASAKEKVEQVYKADFDNQQRMCRQVWDIIWPLAKAGNFEARFSVFTAFRDQNVLAYTTNRLSIISMPAIRVYLYYHSLGAPRLTEQIAYMLERIKAHPHLINQYPEQDAVKKFPKIQACVWEHPSQACTEMLGVSSPTSPTYERLAEELEMLFNAGVGVPCISLDAPPEPMSYPLYTGNQQ